MKKFLPLLLAFLIISAAVYSQDCSTLIISIVSKSNFNGFNVSCYGASNGQFEVSAAGGTGPYSYSIDQFNWLPTGIFSALQAGSYTVRVKDANACENQLIVTLSQPAVLVSTLAVTSSFNGQQVSCSGANDGAITVVASGGKTPYTYSLVGFPGNISGNVSGVYTNLSAGIYSAEVTDANGCDAMTQVVSIVNPVPVLVTAVVTSNYNGTQVSCNNASDGVLTALAIGGTGTYTYSLNEIPSNLSGLFSGVFTHMPPGNHSVSVRDLNNCEGISSMVAITQPSVISASLSGTDASCFQLNNGSLTVTASGGTGGFSYQIIEQPTNISGVISGVFSGLSANAYTIRVTDLNACPYTTAPYQISQPTSIQIETSVNEGTPGNCSDAQLTAIASGGTAPYQYELNEMQNSSGVFTGLSNDTYAIQVRDANNCVKLASAVTISQVSNINATASVTSSYNGSALSCFGSTDGIITIVANGGEGFIFQSVEVPLNSTGNLTGIYTGLAAGTHTFVVSDQNGCETSTVPVAITAPAVISLSAAVTSSYNGAELSCFDSADGRVTLTAQGGTGSYSYTIIDLPNTSGITSGVFTGLTSGTYTFRVRDLNNCSTTSSNITLVDPAPLAVEADIHPDQNGDDGAITLTVSGGTGLYDFLWSTAVTQQNLVGVAAGEYEVIINDANACSLTESFIVPLIVGVDNRDEENTFAVLFDRASGRFYASYELANPATVSVSVFDLTGSMSFHAEKKQKAGHQTQFFSRDSFSPGLYIVNIRINEKVYSKKVLIF